MYANFQRFVEKSRLETDGELPIPTTGTTTKTAMQIQPLSTERHYRKGQNCIKSGHVIKDSQNRIPKQEK